MEIIIQLGEGGTPFHLPLFLLMMVLVIIFSIRARHINKKVKSLVDVMGENVVEAFTVTKPILNGEEASEDTLSKMIEIEASNKCNYLLIEVLTDQYRFNSRLVNISWILFVVSLGYHVAKVIMGA